jgi:hypothetical protein
MTTVDIYIRKADGSISFSPHNGLSGRLMSSRATRGGKRISTRSLTDARIRRELAVASSALGGLVPHTLPFNPAAHVKAGSGRRRKPRPWTSARVERWRETGVPRLCQIEARMIIDTAADTSPVRRSACSVAEARGFEPRMGGKPKPH